LDPLLRGRLCRALKSRPLLFSYLFCLRDTSFQFCARRDDSGMAFESCWPLDCSVFFFFHFSYLCKKTRVLHFNFRLCIFSSHQLIVTVQRTHQLVLYIVLCFDSIPGNGLCREEKWTWTICARSYGIANVQRRRTWTEAQTTDGKTVVFPLSGSCWTYSKELKNFMHLCLISEALFLTELPIVFSCNLLQEFVLNLSILWQTLNL
jgi:hypothetical protein